MKLWPFSEKTDTRPPTASALAIVESLDAEPSRWAIHGDHYIRHDSGIIVGTRGFTWLPNLDDEPNANGDLIADAVDKWVAAVVKLPPPPPVKEAT